MMPFVLCPGLLLPGLGAACRRAAATLGALALTGLARMALPTLHILPPAIAALLQVILIDIVLAGDNAVVIGVSAAKVPLCDRRRVHSSPDRAAFSTS